MKLCSGWSSGIRYGCRFGLAAVLCSGLSPMAVAQQSTADGILGQNGWLFYRYEFVRDLAQSEVSIDLIGKIAKQLEANGTPVLVVMAPIKARIYAEHLPPSHTLSPALKGDYDRLLARLNAAGVHTVNLNAAFSNSPKRNDELPFYFRQDTHWAAPGALLAAQTIQEAILSNPVLKAAYNDTPVVKHSLSWRSQRFPMTGDLVRQLPPPAVSWEPEATGVFDVVSQGGGSGLLGPSRAGITLLGSSYSAEWTQFPKAVAFALQREVPTVFITADRGQWVGLESHLRDAAFQRQRPKLLIWEMPERDLKAPPNMPYREPRYVMDNTEWLARVAAWAQRHCTPASSDHTATANTNRLASTRAQDAIEITLSRPSTQLDYLSAQMQVNGSKVLTVELSGPDVPTHRWALDVAGDEDMHAFKLPLWHKGKGYTHLKLYPGVTKGFAIQDMALCRLPTGLF